MREIFCHKCRNKIGELASRSKIKPGVVAYCDYCNRVLEKEQENKNGDILDSLSRFFNKNN